MILHVTHTSPYARVIRIVVIEKCLSDELTTRVAKTRRTNSPFYDINVSGRVPYLEFSDGRGIEDSREIGAYLDNLDGQPRFFAIDSSANANETSWEIRQLQARATSFIDGLSVWQRELKRPKGEQSPTILQHESERADRLLQWWESNIHHDHMNSALNLPQITLYCALDLEVQIADFDWRDRCPKLADFASRMTTYPSIVQTS